MAMHALKRAIHALTRAIHAVTRAMGFGLQALKRAVASNPFFELDSNSNCWREKNNTKTLLKIMAHHMASYDII